MTLPGNIAETDVIIVDPMLATGGSLSAAVDIVPGLGDAGDRLFGTK